MAATRDAREECELHELEAMEAALPLTYRLSAITYFGPAAGSLAALGVGWAAWSGSLGQVALGHGLSAGGAAMIAACAGSAIVMGVAWLRRTNTFIRVHATRLTYHTGVLTSFERSISLSQVVGVNTLQAFGQGTLGVGTVQLETTGSEVVSCPTMERAREVAYLVQHLIDANRPVPALAAMHAQQDSQA